MPIAENMVIRIGDSVIEVTDPSEIPVSINYNLEDPDDYQQKKSSEAFDITVPATLINSTASNTFNNPQMDDLTSGQALRNYQKATIGAGGYELLVGKALLKKARHTDRPVSFTWNLLGDNADWLIDLKETTLFDLLQHITFNFTKTVIEASWAYNGTNQALPYVFAPVRYLDPFGGYRSVNAAFEPIDDNVEVTYLRPALSKYWLLYWGFKLAGFKIGSTFLDTNYYRRMVMPWTFGNFLNSEGTKLDVHNFLAKSTGLSTYLSGGGSNSFIWNLNVSNDSTNGAYDSNTINQPGGDYSYDTGLYAMTWQYKQPHYGTLDVALSMSINVNGAVNGGGGVSASDLEMRVQWFRNGVLFDGGSGNYNSNGNEVFTISSNISTNTVSGTQDIFCKTQVNPTDNGGTGTIVQAKIYLHSYVGKNGGARIVAEVLQFKLDYFRIPLGGVIDFSNYTALKKYKFLDFLRGEVDLFDFSLKTDSVNKVVYIEPTHPYATGSNLAVKTDGWFKNDFIDWAEKGDLSKEWEKELYADGEREQVLKFQDDPNDGILKTVGDRNVTTLASAKYLLPDRYKSGKQERVNRFYGATMHYDADQFKALGTGTNVGISPQFICIIAENISNTSSPEADNTFLPKSAWYKGLVTGSGAWKWDGTVRQDFPYMFAVNYKDGGQSDPVLSYSDEKIKSGSGFVVAAGLLRRFFLQRFAIMRGGERYTVWMRLNNSDVAGQLHREFKVIAGLKWELITINGYKPLSNDSTQCLLYKWEPVTLADGDSCFPSQSNILTGSSAGANDTKYAQLKCLITDIPKTK